MVRECCWRTVEVEVASFVDEHAAQLTEDWHRQLVRHGHLPAREIMTGIGPVAVRCPRVRDRSVKAPTVSATPWDFRADEISRLLSQVSRFSPKISRFDFTGSFALTIWYIGDFRQANGR
jgi:hypothetical protein